MFTYYVEHGSVVIVEIDSDPDSVKYSRKVAE